MKIRAPSNALNSGGLIMNTFWTTNHPVSLDISRDAYTQASVLFGNIDSVGLTA